jgi:hypothetical protein
VEPRVRVDGCAHTFYYVPNAFRSREAVDDEVKRKRSVSLCQFLNFNAKRETTRNKGRRESNFKNAYSRTFKLFHLRVAVVMLQLFRQSFDSHFDDDDVFLIPSAS